MISISKKDSKKYRLYSAIVLLFGAYIVLMLQRSHADSSQSGGARSLGFLLIFVGTFGAIFAESVEILLNSDGGTFLLRKKNFLASKQRIFSLSQLSSIQVRRLWRSGLLGVYFMNFSFKDGSTFSSGQWSFRKNDIEEEARRIAETLRCEFDDRTVFKHAALAELTASCRAISPLKLATIISFASYVVFYRLKFGQVCMAMWFGTLPVFFIGFVFVNSLLFLRRFNR